MSTEEDTRTERDNIDRFRRELVLSGLRAKPDADLPALLVEAFVPRTTSTTSPVNVKIPALTEQHRKDLAALPEVFGKVAVTEPRLLSEAELRDLVTERDTIDRLLTVMKKRKDETLRENLANHLDRVAEEQGLVSEGEETDAKGHYFVKQDAPVEGTGRKVQAIVSESKATVDSGALLDLLNEGILTRAEYLALTSEPEVRRVWDPAKARKAILKDPSLLDKVAQATLAPRRTLTIKVANDT